MIHGTGKINERATLKEGTSYNENMLDLNELVEKGLLKADNIIDLSEMSEINTLQAATEEQLLMIAPESRAQITAIHLSNNTPVGWNGDIDFHNRQEMDSTIDLTSFKNLDSFQTHFYVNDDLEEIKLPTGVKNILVAHSKMENLDIKEQFLKNDVELNIALVNGSPFDSYDNYSGYYVAEEACFMTVDEYEAFSEDKRVDKRFENIKNEDGTYSIYDHEQDETIAYDLPTPLNLVKDRETSFRQNDGGDGQGYCTYPDNFEVFTVEGTEQVLVLANGALYRPDLSDNPEAFELKGRPELNNPFDLVKLTNISDDKDVKYTLSAFADWGYIDYSRGTGNGTSLYDVARGYAKEHYVAFKPGENGFVEPKSLATAEGLGCKEEAIIGYLAVAGKQKTELSKEDVSEKFSILMDGDDFHKASVLGGLLDNVEALQSMKNTLGHEFEGLLKKENVDGIFKEQLKNRMQNRKYKVDQMKQYPKESGAVVADEIAAAKTRGEENHLTTEALVRQYITKGKEKG